MARANADFYTSVHKGLRRAMFSLVTSAGRLDPHDPESLRVLMRELEDTLGLLEAHAKHEDAFILPLIARVSPELASSLDDAHLELESTANIVQHAFLRIGLTEDHDERAAWALAAHAELATFVGKHLVHMGVEERQVMPALNEHLSVEELEATHANILAAITPDELLRFYACMLPALDPHTRRFLFTNMRQAPQEVFARVCETAQTVLSDADWRDLEALAGLAAA